jgi:hypothetical protein
MVLAGMTGCTAGVLILSACRVASDADRDSDRILEHRIRTALDRHVAK